MAAQLSILIVNWNSWRDLQRCLEALRAHEAAPFEILVIDNGSTDGSVANVRQGFPNVRVQANPSNLGHTRAVNQGFGLVQSDYVLLLDADAEVTRDSVARLRQFLDDRADVSVVAPRTYNTDGTVQESARNFPTFFSGLFGRQSVLTKLFPKNPFSRHYLQREHLDATEPFPVAQVSAACMMLRRSLLEETGLWDEGYPGYWVDTDWCMKLRKLGKKVYCVPAAAVVHHENNQAVKKKSPYRIWMFHWGAYRLYRKHYVRGPLDPRGLLALTGLSLRAGLLIVRNCFRSGSAPSSPMPSPSRPVRSLCEEGVPKAESRA